MFVFRFCLFVALLLASTGCWSSTPTPPPGVAVSGKVQLASGAPLKGGTLVLRPVDGVHGAFAEIQPDGSFALADQRGVKAVVPGNYRVYVRLNDAKHKELARAVPQRYQSSEDGDSDVEISIQEPVSDLRINLKK